LPLHPHRPLGISGFGHGLVVQAGEAIALPATHSPIICIKRADVYPGIRGWVSRTGNGGDLECNDYRDKYLTIYPVFHLEIWDS